MSISGGVQSLERASIKEVLNSIDSKKRSNLKRPETV